MEHARRKRVLVARQDMVKLVGIFLADVAKRNAREAGSSCGIEH
jgi:hypothetical protein